MESILLPTKFEITPGAKPNEGILTLEPCYYGYGTTVGNALRRVLLSSLSGAAVTAVKIKGAQHEFSTIPGVKEDVLEIILNLKLLRLKLHTDEPTKVSLYVKGEKKVTAGDFTKNADVEIVNPEMVLATLTDKKAELEMEITVERGRGYVPAEARPKAIEIGMIMIDALFSPIRTVGYRVQNARVGEITNYDRLIMTIETDGTVSPEDAVRQSAQVVLDYFALFIGGGAGSESPLAESVSKTLVREGDELPETTELPAEPDEILTPGVHDEGETEEKPKKKTAKKPKKAKD